MAIGEGVAGTGLQVSLERFCLGVIIEADHDDGFPRGIFRCVGRLTGVVLLEARPEMGGDRE